MGEFALFNVMFQDILRYERNFPPIDGLGNRS